MGDKRKALVKLTSKNQISLPKALLAKLPATDYFEATVEGGKLIFRPSYKKVRIDSCLHQLTHRMLCHFCLLFM